MAKYQLLALITSLIAHAVITNKKSTLFDDFIGAILFISAVILAFCGGNIYG